MCLSPWLIPLLSRSFFWDAFPVFSDQNASPPLLGCCCCMSTNNQTRPWVQRVCRSGSLIAPEGQDLVLFTLKLPEPSAQYKSHINSKENNRQWQTGLTHGALPTQRTAKTFYRTPGLELGLVQVFGVRLWRRRGARHSIEARILSWVSTKWSSSSECTGVVL